MVFIEQGKNLEVGVAAVAHYARGAEDYFYWLVGHFEVHFGFGFEELGLGGMGCRPERSGMGTPLYSCTSGRFSLLMASVTN